MTAPSRLAAIALGLEAAYGAIAAPVMLLPQSRLTPLDNSDPIEDAGWRGSAAAIYGQGPGLLDSTVSVSGAVYPDSIGYLLAGVLGDVAFSAGTPNYFNFATLNSGTQQPPSYTASILDPTGPLQYAGCKVSALTLAWDPSDVLTHQTSLSGLTATVPNTLALPAASSELPMPSWRTTLQIGGLNDPRLLSASITMNRTIVPKRNITGMQTPWLQRSDVLTVSGTLSFAITNDAYRQQFVKGLTTALNFLYSVGSGAGQRRLQVHCSNVVLTSVARDYGQRWITLDVGFDALANSTDVGPSGGQSPVFATLANAVGSGVYK